MKVLTCSRTFPAGHPRKGEPTYFVEKILGSLLQSEEITIGRCIELARQVFAKDHPMCSYNAIRTYDCKPFKPHTIRNGARFSPGEMVSLRVWQLPGGRYVKGNKQIEFAQVEVKKVWPVEIYATEFVFEFKVNGIALDKEGQEQVALNDGLNLIDFYNWFRIHPKKKGQVFKGQIICWSNEINY